jgi:DNA-binding FadR family transcriptional regulator
MASNGGVSSAVKPVANITLSEQVATQIIDKISAQEWKPGEKLPSEAELCEAFSVGRSTLREALKSLAFSGFVRSKAGEGSFVADQPPGLFGRVYTSNFDPKRDISYIIEARFSLETTIAPLCAERANHNDIARIESLLEKMQECLDRGGEGFLEHDIEFHLAIAAGAKNPFLFGIMQVLREPVLHLMHALKGSGMERAQSEHVALVRALKSHDPKKAQRAMQHHLRTYWRRALVFLDGSKSKSR